MRRKLEAPHLLWAGPSEPNLVLPLPLLALPVLVQPNAEQLQLQAVPSSAAGGCNTDGPVASLPHDAADLIGAHVEAPRQKGDHVVAPLLRLRQLGAKQLLLPLQLLVLLRQIRELGCQRAQRGGRGGSLLIAGIRRRGGLAAAYLGEELLVAALEVVVGKLPLVGSYFPEALGKRKITGRSLYGTELTILTSHNTHM